VRGPSAPQQSSPVPNPSWSVPHPPRSGGHGSRIGPGQPSAFHLIRTTYVTYYPPSCSTISLCSGQQKSTMYSPYPPHPRPLPSGEREGDSGSMGSTKPGDATSLRYVAYYERDWRIGRSLALPGRSLALPWSHRIRRVQGKKTQLRPSRSGEHRLDPAPQQDSSFTQRFTPRADPPRWGGHAP